MHVGWQGATKPKPRERWPNPHLNPDLDSHSLALSSIGPKLNWVRRRRAHDSPSGKQRTRLPPESKDRSGSSFTKRTRPTSLRWRRPRRDGRSSSRRKRKRGGSSKVFDFRSLCTHKQTWTTDSLSFAFCLSRPESPMALCHYALIALCPYALMYVFCLRHRLRRSLAR